MNCEEYRQQVDSSLEKAEPLTRKLHDHMSRCAECLRYWKRAEVLWDARKPVPNDAKVHEDSPITRIAYTIIQQAIRADASGISIESADGGLQVSYRVGDVLREGMSLPGYVEIPLVARFKVMADVDVHCDNRPQEGTIPIRWNDTCYRVVAVTIPEGVHERIEARIERL